MFFPSPKLAIALPILATQAFANPNDIEMLASQIEALRTSYETRLAALEEQLIKMKLEQRKQAAAPNQIRANAFNPEIGAVLQGSYAAFTDSQSSLPGFALAEEAHRVSDGFSLGETELNFDASVDNLFRAHATLGIHSHEGEDEFAMEEAYIDTLPGVLARGTNLRMGRMLPDFGYLNKHHRHTDAFIDRPLPYRSFLGSAWHDDGIQLSRVFGGENFTEVGIGAFRGDSWPFGGASGNGAQARSAFLRFGGHRGQKLNYRLGTSWLEGDTTERLSNEDNLAFVGDLNLFGLDLHLSYAPTGNAFQKEWTFTAEYLKREETGTYEDFALATGAQWIDNQDEGWYAQTTYKFQPRWRLGARYSRLKPSTYPITLAGTELNALGHEPESISAMLDFENSHFSRIRLQFNHEKLQSGNTDDQILIQYTMSIGAHPAHSF